MACADHGDAAARLTFRVKGQNMIDSTKTGYDKDSQLFPAKKDASDKMMIENTENDRQISS